MNNVNTGPHDNVPKAIYANAWHDPNKTTLKVHVCTSEVHDSSSNASHQPVLPEDCGIQHANLEAECHSKCDWSPAGIAMPTGEPQTQVNNNCNSPAEDINL